MSEQLKVGNLPENIRQFLEEAYQQQTPPDVAKPKMLIKFNIDDAQADTYIIEFIKEKVKSYEFLQATIIE